MKAIVLAAGVGRRLASASERPKCLLEFNGATLLERLLKQLRAVGVDGVTLVTGYEADQIASALVHADGPPVLLLHNPRFRLGSILSLWTARPALRSGDDVLVMDADVLCHPDMLARLTTSRHPNCWLMDRGFEAGEEPVKICLEGGRVVEFRKQVDPRLTYTVVGESVGFFRFDAATAGRLAELADAYAADGRANLPHEEALRDLALEAPGRIGVEDVTGVPWIEIDFPDDVERARQDILPRVDGSSLT